MVLYLKMLQIQNVRCKEEFAAARLELLEADRTDIYSKGDFVIENHSNRVTSICTTLFWVQLWAQMARESILVS